MPAAACRASNTRRRADPAGASSSSREFGTRASTAAHRASVGAVTLQKLFRQPNVTNPLAAAGRSPTGGPSVSGS